MGEPGGGGGGLSMNPLHPVSTTTTQGRVPRVHDPGLIRAPPLPLPVGAGRAVEPQSAPATSPPRSSALDAESRHLYGASPITCRQSPAPESPRLGAKPAPRFSALVASLRRHLPALSTSAPRADSVPAPARGRRRGPARDRPC